MSVPGATMRLRSGSGDTGTGSVWWIGWVRARQVRTFYVVDVDGVELGSLVRETAAAARDEARALARAGGAGSADGPLLIEEATGVDGRREVAARLRAVGDPGPALPTNEAIAAAAVLAVGRRTRDGRTIAEAARAAHRAGGPSIPELEHRIAAHRASSRALP